MEKLVLEPSTNTHVLTAEKIVDKKIDESTIKIKTNGNGVVTHGEHGTMRIESVNSVKYVQKELNPVTKKMQNAFD